MRSFLRLFFALLFFLITPSYADDIEELKKEVDSFYQKHKDAVEEIRYTEMLSRVKGESFPILHKYKTPYSQAIQYWLFIVYQDKNNSMAGFVNQTSLKIDAYLDKLRFDEKDPMSQEDYTVLSKEIKAILENAEKYSIKNLNKKLISRGNVFIRGMPILISLTRQKKEDNHYLVLKKGEPFNLIHGVKYQSIEKDTSYWGYIKTEKNDEGWVNLKYARIAQ